MTIHWGPLLSVFLVSLGSTVAVVVLVTVSLLGLSARTTRVGATDATTRNALFTPTAGASVAGTCLALTAAIVLFGIWAIVAR